MNPKCAVVYARVSDRKQALRDLPVESQIEACRRKAQQLGAAVLQVYRDDGVRGGREDRRGFVQAVEHAIATAADFLIVWDSARFARSIRISENVKWQLACAGVRVIYAAVDIDLSTDAGWLADKIQQVMDEERTRTTSRDTRRSMMQAAARGFFMGGTAPFGYKVVPAPAEPKRRMLTPDADEAPVLQSIFEHSSRGVGAFAIAAMLNEQGLTLRGRPWSKNTILGMLKSEVYVGDVIYNRFDRAHKRERPAEEWIRIAAHEPLVTRERWAEVQVGLAERVPTDEQHAPGNAQRPFAGLLRCGLCGAGLKVTSGTGRSGKVYYYYACNADVQSGRCGFKRLSADPFDHWLLAELLDRILTAENVQAVLDQMDDAAAGWAKERAARRRALVGELRGAEERRRRLYEVLELQGRDAPGIEELAPRLRELTEQIKRAEAALAQLETRAEPAVGQLGVSAEHAASVLRDMVTGCEDPKVLRSFVGSIVERVVVDENEVRLEYHPECLVRDAAGEAVRSTSNWLPDLGSNQGPTD